MTKLVLDLSKLNTPNELQSYLAHVLDFPDWYGNNWSAYWDMIARTIDLPDELIIVGLGDLAKVLPDEAKYFKKYTDLYIEQYADNEGVKVEYK